MLQQKQKYNNIMHYGLLILSGILIFLVSIRHIQELTNLMAWDELGYWGSAAYIAGYDWSSIVSTFSGYYSYGYSIILALLIKFLSCYGYAYQAAIFINGLLLTASFFLAYFIGITYFGREARNVALLASLTVSFYANNITQACYAWTECMLIFLYWVLVALFCSINKRYNFIKFLLIGLVSIYMLIVHTRSVGIVIASFVMLLLMVVYRKIPLKDFFIFVLFIAILIFMALILKTDIRSAVWTSNGDKAMVNTLAGTTPWIYSKLKSLLGIINIAKTFLIRFFYFGLTTFMIFFVFLQTAIKQLWESLKKREFDFCIAFMVLSMLGIFGVLSLQLSQSGTYQAFMYGRYQDIIAGPLFLFGLMYFFDSNEKKQYYYETAIYSLILFVLYQVTNSIPIYKDYYVINCNVELDRYWLGTSNGGYKLLLPILISMTIFVCMCVARYLYINNRKRGIGLLLCLSLLFCYREYTASENVYDKTYTSYYGMQQFIQEASEICVGNSEIYFYNATDMGLTQPMAFMLQFKMYDCPLQIVSSVDNLERASYLFVPCKKLSEDEYVPTADVDGKLILMDKFLALYEID